MKYIQISVSNFEEHRSILVKLLKKNYVYNFNKEVYPILYFDNKIDQLFEYIQEKKAEVIICKVEVVVGYIWCYESVFIDERRWHISDFYLEKEFRNMGIGTQLLSMALEIGKERGLNIAELLVTASNEKAVEFYGTKDFRVSRYLMTKSF